ncbi:hypothetical protein B296_00045719, partial [Ensete ventricosum]
LHTRWFIEACEREAKMNPVLLELAKLDFNRVQIIYQRELKEVSRWWSNLGLAQNLPFSRDRLVENYFWTVGWVFEPQFGRCRELHTKANCLITTIDDVYDVYGTMDELKLFTDAVDRTSFKEAMCLNLSSAACMRPVYRSMQLVSISSD